MVFANPSPAEAEERFLGSALPVARDVAFGEAVAEQDDFVTDAVEGTEFDEGRLHADFNDAAGSLIDETGAGAKAVGIAAADDAVTGGGEAGIAGGTVGFARFNQGSADARGALIEGQTRAHGIEPNRGVHQQGRTRGMAEGVGHSAGPLVKLLRLRWGGGMGENFGDAGLTDDFGEVVEGTAEPLLAAIDGECGPCVFQQGGPLKRPDGGMDAMRKIIGGIIGIAQQRDGPFPRESIQVIFHRFGGVEHIKRIDPIANYRCDPLCPQPIGVGFDDGDQGNRNALRDRLGISAKAGQVDTDCYMSTSRHHLHFNRARLLRQIFIYLL